jgi:glucose/arabinose dehydrogenase
MLGPSMLPAALLLTLALTGCAPTRRAIVRASGTDVPEQEPDAKLKPAMDGLDAKREPLKVMLREVATGPSQITDLQFVPGEPDLLVALGKLGTAKWIDLAAEASGTLFEVEVLRNSEQGLLGLAFHPGFAENGRLFLNHTVESEGKEVTHVAEWEVAPGANLRTAKPRLRRVILEVSQPYANHNAGQIAFGPGGMLYVGFGDGGWRNDPHGHGQDRTTRLGSIVRFEVDLGRVRVETFAVGLRNPWRFSFDPGGRLIVADVGQYEWEEIDVVEHGANLGWSIREGRHCFDPSDACREKGLVDPVYEYGREDGGSVTGGYVATGDHVPALKGLYVFGDFLSGRLWAIKLPGTVKPGAPLLAARALGRWPVLPSTFGRSADGRIFVADYPSGRIFRIDPPPKPEPLDGEVMNFDPMPFEDPSPPGGGMED